MIVAKPMGVEEAKRLGIKEWSTWECEPSSFPWQYSEQETAFIYEGDVIVTYEGHSVHLTENMLVSFPKGLKCHWEVRKTIRKAYIFNFPLE